jgi:hypothetical protein
MKSDAGSIERQGAAQGLSEVLAGMDVAYVSPPVMQKLELLFVSTLCSLFSSCFSGYDNAADERPFRRLEALLPEIVALTGHPKVPYLCRSLVLRLFRRSSN